MRNLHLGVIMALGVAGAFSVDACVGDSTVVQDGGPDGTTSDVVSNDVSADINSDAPQTGPINGTILAIDGTPLGLKVEANGQVTTADATTGAFTLPDPGPTYTITFLYNETNVPQPLAFVYQGMTRRDPLLMMPLRVFPYPMTISGTVPNALPTIPNALTARLVFAPKKVVGDNTIYTTIVTDGGAFSTTTMDFPGKSQTGTLYFYERDTDDAGNASGYPLVASLSGVGFANGNTAVETFDASSTPSTGNVGWSVTTPSAGSWTVGKTSLRAIFGGTTPVQLDQVVGTSAFTFLAPNIGQLVIDTNATSSTNATSTAWNTGITVNSSGISLTLPNPPVVASPAAGTTVPLASTPFIYNSVPGVALVSLQCYDAGGDGGPSSINYAVRVITTATSVTAPVDAALSVAAAPSGSSCTFTVGGLALYTTVDGAADPGGYANAFSAEYATVNGSFAVSAPQTVTAQ